MNIQVFDSPQFGQITTATIDGKEYFAATECAVALGYSNPYDAIGRHCRSLVKREVPHPQSPDKTIEMGFIPEGDLYRLIARSHLPAAEQFERWVFDEVLPDIRKHGIYATPATLDQLLEDPDRLIEVLQKYSEEKKKRLAYERAITAQNKVLEEQRPLVTYARKINDCEGGVTLTMLCKVFKQNGQNIKRHDLIDMLIDDGFLYREEAHQGRLRAYSKHVTAGLFWEREVAVNRGDGFIVPHVQVTPRGQQYFLELYAEVV